MGIITWNTYLRGPMQISFSRPPTPDPNTVFLITGQGTPESTVLTDSSMYGRSITTFGTYTYKTTYSKYYSTSVLGSAPGAFSVALSQPGANKSWTWETWFYATSTQLSGAGSGLGFLTLDNTGDWIIMSQGPDNGGTNQFGLLKPFSGTWYALSATSLPANQWAHLAMSFVDNGDGTGVLRSFINGILSGTSAMNSGNFVQLPISSNGVVISGRNSPAGFSNANYYFSDFRISQGVARYTSSFNPPQKPLI